MSFYKKLSGVLSESLSRPGVIYMKRGTIIEAHHIRPVRQKSGDPLIIAGIHPGHFKHVFYTSTRGKGKAANGLLRSQRDFSERPCWEPDPLNRSQDETGWCEPDEYGHYNASRILTTVFKFKNILTINPKNIDRIEWIR